MTFRVLVTGATDGIGACLVADYARAGADIIATGRRMDADREHGWPAHVRYVVADQSNATRAADAIFRAVSDKGWNGIDAAILNAGIGQVGDPAEDDAIAAQVEVNLAAPILIARTLAPYLLEAKGTLTLIGSTSRRAPDFAAYAATKAGLAGFARSLREEWRGRAHVQILHPGPTRTNMHEKAGLQIGAMRNLFMGPETVARGIERAVARKSGSRNLSRAWCMTARPLAEGGLK